MKCTNELSVKIIFLSLIFSFLAIGNSNAQILKKLKEKAKEEAKEKVEEKTGETTDSDRNAKQKSATKAKEIAELKSHIETGFKNIESDLENEQYDMTQMYINKTGQRIETLKNDYNVNTGDYEEKLSNLTAKFENASKSAAIEEDTKDMDFQYIKEAKWALSPLYNMMDPPVLGMMQNINKANDFYKHCADIDFGAVKIKAEEIKNKYPEDFQEDYEMHGDYEELCVEFPKWFDKEVVPFMTKEINSAIEKAYQLKSKGTDQINQALQTAKAALITSRGVLLIKPGHAKTLQLRKDAQKAVDDIEAQLTDLVYTSDIHKENAGNIVFSKSPITIKKEEPEKFTDSFTPDDYIYGMMYLKGTLIEQAKADKTVVTEILVDGNKVAEHEWGVWSDAKEKTYVDLEVIPNPDKVETHGAIKYTQGLSTISPRNHTVKVVLRRKGSNVIAEGEFNLDCSSGVDKIAAIAKELKEKQLEKVRMPKAAMKNNMLEYSMRKAMQKHWPDEKPLRAVITSDRWTMHYHAVTGAIMYRTIDAAVAFKTKEGDCKIFYLTFKQPYNGTGFGHTEYHSVGGHQVIKCHNVNK